MPEEAEIYNYFNSYCFLYAYDIDISGNHINMNIEERINDFSGYTVSWRINIDAIINEDYTFMSGRYDYFPGNAFQPEMFGKFEATRK